MGVSDLGPRHVRAGRVLLGWNVARLAKEAGIADRDIVAIEDDRIERLGRVASACSALGKAGIRFEAGAQNGAVGVAADLLLSSLSPLARQVIEERRLIFSACGLLKWSRRKLIGRSGVKAAALRRAWEADEALPLHISDRILQCLVREGIEFQRGARIEGLTSVRLSQRGILSGNAPRPWE